MDTHRINNNRLAEQRTSYKTLSQNWLVSLTLPTIKHYLKVGAATILTEENLGNFTQTYTDFLAELSTAKKEVGTTRYAIAPKELQTEASAFPLSHQDPK